MVATGFTNNFTSGEISDDAWDRTDIQPVSKGCEEATNYVVAIAGPLRKRRGFWRLGDVLGATQSRMLPFRKSIDDALMLEFGDGEVRVWNNDGSVLKNGGAPVVFASPYAAADLDGLRYKQVGDVIYLRHRDGKRPRTLTRNSNVSWTFTDESFPDGPWRTENADKGFTVAVNAVSGNMLDGNAEANGAGAVAAGGLVNLVASAPLFDPGQVGAQFRLRAGAGAPSVKAWSAGYRNPVGQWCVSVGRVYNCTGISSHDETVTNPPTQTEGEQSDGGNIWVYVHDGAGIVQITAVTDSTHASGTVLKTLPIPSGSVTSYFAEAAYSDFRGWPRMWPAVREERLVEGATASNLDFLDLTQTAGFTPTAENFSPGLGTGQILATDAVRRRVGEDGAELIWATEAGYLIVGSASGEYLVAGSVLDQAISPSSVITKDLSSFGSADAPPVRAHKGLIFVARGGQTLREVAVDANQNDSGDDLSILAQHIVSRGVSQLAWAAQPENTLWLRLADGGLAMMVYHKEQQVRGFCRVALPDGVVCEDIAVLPGPGRRETLWIQVSRLKAGVTQRWLWMMSQPSDALFGVDGADLYFGAGSAEFSGLDHYEGEFLRAKVDGVQYNGVAVTGGVATFDRAISKAYIGLPIKSRFKSLKLDRQLGGDLLQRQRVVGCIVGLMTAKARVSVEIAAADGTTTVFSEEAVLPRTAADFPAAAARRVIQSCTLTGDTDTDPRIVIEDETAYDGAIYSLKPQVESANG